MNGGWFGIAAALLAAAAPAYAQGPYLGARVGIMTVDGNGFDDATNAGLLVGYELMPDNAPVRFAVEAEFTTSVSDGDFRVLGVEGDWEIDTQAIYAAVRAGEQFYAKGRIGFLNEDVTASAGGTSVNGDDSGMSVGVGGGWRINQQVSIEAEYTLIEADVDFWGLGLNYAF